jgi:hypothetical protein
MQPHRRRRNGHVDALLWDAEYLCEFRQPQIRNFVGDVVDACVERYAGEDLGLHLCAWHERRR